MIRIFLSTVLKISVFLYRVETRGIKKEGAREETKVKKESNQNSPG